jgi:MFS transporter, ACS family, hexuronate transporter
MQAKTKPMRIMPLRWGIVALISLGTILNYLARNSLGVMAATLEHDLRFDTAHYSYIVGAFQLAYTLMQPVAGFIIDHIGLQRGFALFAAAWSVANMLHGLATGWLSLAAFRLLLGVSEAAAIPAGMKAIAEWFPVRERSIATGWFNVGTSFGAMLAPIVVGRLALAYNWRVAFAVTGVGGLLWAALWFAFYRAPAAHPAISRRELAHITAGQERAPQVHKASVREIIGTSRFWAIAVPRFLAEPAWQTFSFWIPLYLMKARHMDLAHIALYAWLPFLAADFGGVCGGYLSPLLMRTLRLELVPSRVLTMCVAALLMIAPGCIGLALDATTAIALLCVGGFAHQIISVSLNTLSADMFAPSEVATANGFVGMAGWSGGLLFTLAIGQLVDRLGYVPIFAALAVFDLIGAAWLLLMLPKLRRPDREAV